MRVPVLREKKKQLTVLACFLGVLLMLAGIWNRKEDKENVFQGENVSQKTKSGIGEMAGDEIVSFLVPLFEFGAHGGARGYDNLMESLFLSHLPVFSYTRETEQRELPYQDDVTWQDLLAEGMEEKTSGGTEDQEAGTEDNPEESAEIEEALTLEEALERENRTARGETENSMEDLEEDTGLDFFTGDFIPHEKQMTYNLSDYQEYSSLFETFYAIDSNTMIGSEQLNLDRLLGPDVTVDKNAPGPQILLYHTHSQEAFADSVPGDTSTTIVGAGDKLAALLTEEYGYSVLHHTGEYDVPDRDGAYNRSLPELEQILADNPTIQVIIDLHRDGISEDRRLVTELDGKPTARFMFFNGLSRTKNTGDIDYLKNPYQDANLALSFRMELAANEYYPGLTRKIYLNGYRYNMHLQKSLLIELGAQTNTVEEIMNAIDPLAHILDLVFSGEAAVVME